MNRVVEDRTVPPHTVIAIDGPAGSGKSTTARALAERFDLLYVDSGAMYRALTWAALDRGQSFADEAGLLAMFTAADLQLDPARRETRVFWDGKDISDQVRTPAIEANVSAVAAHPAIRAAMVERQRSFARRRGVVMEGRDIGSVVFPLASAKIYLDASLEARAERRLNQHRRRGNETEFETVLAEVEARDNRDSSRAESPLSIPPDAVVTDNSRLSLDEQLERTAEAVITVLDEQRPRSLTAASLSSRVTIRYKFAYAVFGPLSRILGLTIHGREHVEFDEGKILAANHVSNLDPPMLAASLEGMGHFRAVAKEELFRFWPSRMIFKLLHSIPIKRSIFDADAFDTAAEYLAEGQNVVFFPEGMRRVVGEPGPVRNGLGQLMMRTEAPAVPVFFRGTTVAVPGSSPNTPLEVTFAPPVRLRALAALRNRLDDRGISRLIAQLFDQIYLELQARSFARTPMTTEERESADRARPKVLRKEAKTFRREKS